MKTIRKVILILMSVIMGAAILFAAFSAWILSSYFKGMKEQADNFDVEYRTPEELSAIAGVSITEAELIDSCFIDHFSMGGYTIRAIFAIPQRDHKTLLKKLSKEAAANIRWTDEEDGFKMEFFPDLNDQDWTDGIDARKVELNGQMVDDWDGNFFRMTVPRDSCRIILDYGWSR